MGVIFGEFKSTSTLRSSHGLAREEEMTVLIPALSSTGHFSGSGQRDTLPMALVPFIWGHDGS